MLSFWKTAIAFVIVAVSVPLFVGALHPGRPVAALARRDATTAATLNADFRARVYVSPTPSPAPATPRPHPVATPAPVVAQPVVTQAQPVAVAPVAAAPVFVPPPPTPRPAPPPAIVIGSTQQVLINQDRAGAGLRPLSWSSCLASIAYQSAARMAAQGYISHAGAVGQAFGCGLGSRQTGENVGFWSAGINDSQLNSMFMASPEHRANIMGPYRYVGTAWVVARNGYAYISVVFA